MSASAQGMVRVVLGLADLTIDVPSAQPCLAALLRLMLQVSVCLWSASLCAACCVCSRTACVACVPVVVDGCCNIQNTSDQADT